MNAIPSPSGRIAMSTDDALAYARQAIELGRQTGTSATRCLQYGSDPAQSLEVYEPAQAQGLPVLLFFHGGAWTHGGLDWLRFMAPAVLSMPAVFVAATYRLAPEHRWPAAYDDACAALAYVETLARQAGYDASRIIVSGHSAGGHLAALAALKGDFPWLKACFPVSSRYDLRHPNPAPGSGEERVYKLVLADPAQDAPASPLLYADRRRLPFHIVWGGRDFARVSSSSVAMVQALQAHGSAVTQVIVPDAGHFDTHLQLADPGHAWYARLQEAWTSC